MRQDDLFALLVPECGGCPNLGSAIDSGIRYCWGELTWRWSTDRVEGCVYRERVIPRPVRGNPVDAIRGLLEDPKHSISPKDRRWLQRELKVAVADTSRQIGRGPGRTK